MHWPEAFNLADFLLDERIREGKGDRVALLCGDESRTYAEVQAQANRYAGLLEDRGVQPEQRVILSLPDGFAYVAALFGILKRGAVAVMVNPDLAESECRDLQAYSRARLAFTDRPHWDNPILPTDNVLERFPAHRDNERTHRDDPALWIFSGGTTGRPKAAVQSHRSFANTTQLYARDFLGYREDDRTLAVPKLFFGYATGSNLFFPFSVGATSCLFPERSTPEAVFRNIKRYRPTLLVNVPTMVHKMLQEGPTEDLSSLRLATSAGEALAPSLYQQWRDAYGVELVDGLGTAEMWHIFLSNKPGEVRPGTLGRAVPGFTVKVAGEDGVPLINEPGRLWVKGGSRAHGYWHEHDKSMEAFRGEWFVSSDLVVEDDDGFISHCGRQDDLLKVGGQWVAPQDVEDCLLQHPAVRECALVGIATPDGLTRPRAYVVTSAPISADELKTYCLERLAPHKHPREVVFLDTLPRTHLGKIDRGALRARQ